MLKTSPVLYGVPAELNVGSPDAGVKTGLGDLHGRHLVLDGLLEELDVLLHVKHLLQNLQHNTR